MEMQGLCGMCQAGCEIIAAVEDGRLVRVSPDNESPRGRLCPRGALSPELVHSPLRLTAPLIRKGERGKGEFSTATWEEALDRVYEMWSGVVRQYGAGALASYFGRGVLGEPLARFNAVYGPVADAFLTRLGSPNDMSSSSICYHSANTIAPGLTMGLAGHYISPDIKHSDRIFIWGKNPATDEGPQLLLKSLRKAKEHGAEIIVIDPRGKGIAEEADWWIPVYPGTDGALALAMLKVILESGRYDKVFVKRHTRGFDEFMQYLAAQDTAALCRVCHISTKTLQKLADHYCASEKCSFVAYTGLEYQLSGMQNYRMLYLLWGLTGKLDVPGGQLINAESLPGYPYVADRDLMPIGSEKYPIFYKFLGAGQFTQLPRAVLEGVPYPVRALMVVGGSPACTFPGGDLWRETYLKLDSLVVLDRYMTEECLYADVVLPCSTAYETECVEFFPGMKRLRRQIIPGVGESKAAAFILAAIADKFGFGGAYPHNSEEMILWQLGGDRKKAALLRERGFLESPERERHYKKYDSGLLRRDSEPGFPTPSGKFEIASTVMEEYGYVAYPEYQDISSRSEAGGEDFPLMMTSGARSSIRHGSFGPNMPRIAAAEPVPCAEISSETAAVYGIKDGDPVRVVTAFGACPFTAKIIPMVQGAIQLPHGGGSSLMPKAWREGNANALCSLDLADPLTGFPIIKSLPCRIELI